LVVEGVHPHKKDQILGHAADDMSRVYGDDEGSATIVEPGKRQVFRLPFREMLVVADKNLPARMKLTDNTNRRAKSERMHVNTL
jgi:hypothetical protein